MSHVEDTIHWKIPDRSQFFEFDVHVLFEKRTIFAVPSPEAHLGFAPLKQQRSRCDDDTGTEKIKQEYQPSI